VAYFTCFYSNILEWDGSNIIVIVYLLLLTNFMGQSPS
jgi:hypothetical protein